MNTVIETTQAELAARRQYVVELMAERSRLYDQIAKIRSALPSSLVGETEDVQEWRELRSRALLGEKIDTEVLVELEGRLDDVERDEPRRRREREAAEAAVATLEAQAAALLDQVHEIAPRIAESRKELLIVLRSEADEKVLAAVEALDAAAAELIGVHWAIGHLLPPIVELRVPGSQVPGYRDITAEARATEARILAEVDGK